MGDEFLPTESEAKVVNGWIALLIVLALLAFGAYFVGAGLGKLETGPLTAGIALIAVGLICMRGMFTLQPNQAEVTLFFGSYAGTARHAGFHWTNPFCLRRRLSLRAHNLTTPRVTERRDRKA